MTHPLSSSFLRVPMLSSPRHCYTTVGAANSLSLRQTSTGSVSREKEFANPMAALEDGKDDRIARIASSIRVIPDFPKPGIMFQDITTLLLEPKTFKDTIDLFVERYREMGITVVAGIEARGFIFGPPIALAIGAKFVPMRKPNKLPGKVISEEYSLEYGTDKLEMHEGAVEAGEHALVIDDLIATGGTLCAAVRLLGCVWRNELELKAEVRLKAEVGLKAEAEIGIAEAEMLTHRVALFGKKS